MRNSCWGCVIKHLGQANACLEESGNYPHHLGYAFGHLEEAAVECDMVDAAFAKKLRDYRTELMEEGPRSGISMDELMIGAFLRAGYKLSYGLRNSKTFGEELQRNFVEMGLAGA